MHRFCLLIAPLLVAVGAPSAVGLTVPVYAWTTGDMVRYSIQHTKNGDIVHDGALLLWCLHADASGSELLLVESRRENGRSRAVSAGVLRIDSLGRGGFDEALSTLGQDPLVLRSVVPHLNPPLNPRDEWTSPETAHLPPLTYRWASATSRPAQTTRAVGHVRTTPAPAAWPSGEVLGEFGFELASHIVVEATLQRAESTDVRVALVDRRRVAPTWCTARRTELEALRRRLGLESRALERVRRMSQTPDEGRRATSRVWREFSREIADRSTPVRAMASLAVANRASRLADAAREGAVRHAWVGQPAAPWSLQNQSGETVRSESIRIGPSLEIWWDASAQSARFFESIANSIAPLVEAGHRVVAINVDTDRFAALRFLELENPTVPCVLAGPILSDVFRESLPLIRVIGEHGKTRAVEFEWNDRVVEALRARESAP